MMYDNSDDCVISGFRRGVNEIYALLGSYAAWIGNYVPTFRDSLSVPPSRSKLESLTFENGTDRSSRNVCT